MTRDRAPGGCQKSVEGAGNDASDPAAPVEIGFVDTPGIARGVAVDGNFADLADGSPAGVLVFDGFESGDTLMWAPR